MGSEIALKTDSIRDRIYAVRGMQVMLDRDLAELYGVETKVLNQAVKRNIDRFPAEFMFQLTLCEVENWKSQFVTSNREKMGLRKLPFAFTEQGVAMLSGVLKSTTTDMAKKFGDDVLIYQWMRNRNTVELLGIWEQIHNADFKGVEFDTFKKQAGMNSFSLTPKKWIEATDAIGIISKAGRYGGGTYAHRDIALEFGSWLSPQFKLYLIKEFQRLKAQESEKLRLGWDIKRTLTKINYKIHTDAIKKHLVPPYISKQSATVVYANEADVLNVALFGKTAKEWRDNNSEKAGNIRDYADVTQLVQGL